MRFFGDLGKSADEAYSKMSKSIEDMLSDFVVKLIEDKEAVKKDEVSLKDIIAFYKQEEIISVLNLKKEIDILPIVYKRKSKREDDRISLFCVLFDRKNDKLFSNGDSKYFTLFLTKKLDEDLTDAFGDKEMIVLK